MLQKVQFAPGFNKQVTATGGEGQWVAGDNVRFRYGKPENIPIVSTPVPKPTKVAPRKALKDTVRIRASIPF